MVASRVFDPIDGSIGSPNHMAPYGAQWRNNCSGSYKQ